MTNFKKYFTSFFPLFFAVLYLQLFLSSNTYAQNDIEYNYLKIKHQVTEKEGALRYMTFHDHNSSINLPYHEHYYRDPLTNSTEIYTLTTLEGQWYLNSRTLAYIHIPYLSNRRDIDNSLNEKVKKSGLGDIIIGGKYYLYNSALYRPSSNLKQYLLFGVGAKVPTGNYTDFDNATLEIEPTFQPGSGTVDFLLSADYQLQYQHFILQAAATYRINQENKYTYIFGNQLNIGLEALYEWSLTSNVSIVPNVSLQFSDTKSNELNGNLINGFPAGSDRMGTGGQFLWGGVGMAVKMKQTQLQFDYYLPLNEQFIGSQLAHNYRWEVGVRWDFGRGNLLKTSRGTPAF